jgi:hypothetical protein
MVNLINVLAFFVSLPDTILSEVNEIMAGTDNVSLRFTLQLFEIKRHLNDPSVMWMADAISAAKTTNKQR